MTVDVEGLGITLIIVVSGNKRVIGRETGYVRHSTPRNKSFRIESTWRLILLTEGAVAMTVVVITKRYNS